MFDYPEHCVHQEELLHFFTELMSTSVAGGSVRENECFLRCTCSKYLQGASKCCVSPSSCLRPLLPSALLPPIQAPRSRAAGAAIPAIEILAAAGI
jgi:hypothetical protein